MGIPDSTLAKYRFALVQTAHFKQPTYIADGEHSLGQGSPVAHELCRHFYAEDIIYDHKWMPDDALGLDHIDKTGRAGRTGGNERAIVIKG
jgi:ubiquitin carboxyl-terminal hydrolase 7